MSKARLIRQESADELKSIIAAKVRVFIDEHGCTTDEFAKFSGLSRGTILKIKAGTCTPTLTTMVRLASAMGTNIIDLADVTDVKVN